MDEEMEVIHPHWRRGRLQFHGETFVRMETGCKGWFEQWGAGCLLLVWEEWPAEILRPNGAIVPAGDYGLEWVAAWERGEAVIPGVWRVEAELRVTACLVTYSRERLHHLCSLVGCMKAQKERSFVHVIHLIGYTGTQIRFLRAMVGDDPRFILRATVPLTLKSQFRHALADAIQVDAGRYIKVDDDDLYTPEFLGTILKEADSGDFVCGRSLFCHRTTGNKSWIELESGLFGNNMCFSKRAVRFLMDHQDDPRWAFEDSHAHHLLREGGFREKLFTLEFPHVLYLRHGANTI